MKKKFVKPEITQYAAETAWGQDATFGHCTNGTRPSTELCGTGGAPNATPDCNFGEAVGPLYGACNSGATVGTECINGTQVG